MFSVLHFSEFFLLENVHNWTLRILSLSLSPLPLLRIPSSGTVAYLLPLLLLPDCCLGQVGEGG